jgi:predicted SPOUT superfamily RNA methylase MTH1
MQKINLTIAIPSNFLEDSNDLRAKTQKIGQIARAAAIYRVRQIAIYSIGKLNQKKYLDDAKFIKKILEYLDCPQYLRKKIFPKRPEFKYVGVLPPLRTPHHPLESKLTEIDPVSIREGIVLSSNSKFSEIEIGLDKVFNIKIPNLPKNKRIIFKIKKRGNSISGVPIQKSEIKKYWGYEVKFFQEALNKFIERFSKSLKIATSKKGSLLKMKDLDLFQKLGDYKGALLLFGSPSMGLFDIFGKNNLELRDWVDYVINFIPKQGTQTVRAEEAIVSALAIINYLLNL